MQHNKKATQWCWQGLLQYLQLGIPDIVSFTMDLEAAPPRPFGTEPLLLACLLLRAAKSCALGARPAHLQMSCDGLERGTAAHHVTIQTLKKGIPLSKSAE